MIGGYVLLDEVFVCVLFIDDTIALLFYSFVEFDAKLLTINSVGVISLNYF